MTDDNNDGGLLRRRRAAEARAQLQSNNNAVCATAPAAILRLRMSNRTRACQVGLICFLALLRILSLLGYDGIILDLLSAAAAVSIGCIVCYRWSQNQAPHVPMRKPAWLEEPVSLDILDDLCLFAILQHLPSVVDMVNSGTTCSRLRDLADDVIEDRARQRITLGRAKHLTEFVHLPNENRKRPYACEDVLAVAAEHAGGWAALLAGRELLLDTRSPGGPLSQKAGSSHRIASYPPAPVNAAADNNAFADVPANAAADADEGAVAAAAASATQLSSSSISPISAEAAGAFILWDIVRISRVPAAREPFGWGLKRGDAVTLCGLGSGHTRDNLAMYNGATGMVLSAPQPGDIFQLAEVQILDHPDPALLEIAEKDTLMVRPTSLRILTEETVWSGVLPLLDELAQVGCFVDGAWRMGSGCAACPVTPRLEAAGAGDTHGGTGTGAVAAPSSSVAASSSSSALADAAAAATISHEANESARSGYDAGEGGDRASGVLPGAARRWRHIFNDSHRDAHFAISGDVSERRCLWRVRASIVGPGCAETHLESMTIDPEQLHHLVSTAPGGELPANVAVDYQGRARRRPVADGFATASSALHLTPPAPSALAGEPAQEQQLPTEHWPDINLWFANQEALHPWGVYAAEFEKDVVVYTLTSPSNAEQSHHHCFTAYTWFELLRDRTATHAASAAAAEEEEAVGEPSHPVVGCRYYCDLDLNREDRLWDIDLAHGNAKPRGHDRAGRARAGDVSAPIRRRGKHIAHNIRDIGCGLDRVRPGLDPAVSGP